MIYLTNIILYFVDLVLKGRNGPQFYKTFYTGKCLECLNASGLCR